MLKLTRLQKRRKTSGTPSILVPVFLDRWPMNWKPLEQSHPLMAQDSTSSAALVSALTPTLPYNPKILVCGNTSSTGLSQCCLPHLYPLPSCPHPPTVQLATNFHNASAAAIITELDKSLVSCQGFRYFGSGALPSWVIHSDLVHNAEQVNTQCVGALCRRSTPCCVITDNRSSQPVLPSDQNRKCT